jgi:hypothetical protein
MGLMGELKVYESWGKILRDSDFWVGREVPGGGIRL